MCTYVRKSSKHNADLQRTATALTAAQKYIRDAVARNMQNLRNDDGDSSSNDDDDDDDGAGTAGGSAGRAEAAGGGAPAAPPATALDDACASWLDMNYLNTARWLIALICVQQLLRNLSAFDTVRSR